MQRIDHLAEANKKKQLLIDRVTGVAKGLKPGLLVYGRGGTGKSFVVTDHLKALNVSYQTCNSHSTPLKLCELLASHPNEIILLEDCESILTGKVSLGILRSATESSTRDRNGNPVRIVHYNGRPKMNFQFNGGVIMLMNQGLSSDPVAQALASRIETVNYNPSSDEVGASMKELATKGYRIDQYCLSPDECTEIVDFVIDESRRCGGELNFRMMRRAFEDYYLADSNGAGCSWKDLVSSMIMEQPCVLNPISQQSTRKTQHERQLQIAREICILKPEERNRRWCAATKKSPATMYRRLTEIGIHDEALISTPNHFGSRHRDCGAEANGIIRCND